MFPPIRFLPLTVPSLCWTQPRNPSFFPLLSHSYISTRAAQFPPIPPFALLFSSVLDGSCYSGFKEFLPFPIRRQKGLHGKSVPFFPFFSILYSLDGPFRLPRRSRISPPNSRSPPVRIVSIHFVLKRVLFCVPSDLCWECPYVHPRHFFLQHANDICHLAGPSSSFANGDPT